MRELSVAEQRYRAVLAVVSDGRTVTEVAAAVGSPGQSLHAWLARYEAEGLEGLADRSHRPSSCPHQMPAVVEAAVLGEARLGQEVLDAVSRGNPVAQGALDEWVTYYNTERPHQALDYDTPAARFEQRPEGATAAGIAAGLRCRPLS